MFDLIHLSMLQTAATGNAVLETPLTRGDWARIVIALLAFAVLSIVAYWNMVRNLKPNRENLGNFVAFNAMVAMLAGGALVVGSSRNWTIMLLVAGTCLGVGFIFGLLFGFPLSSKPPNTGNGGGGNQAVNAGNDGGANPPANAENGGAGNGAGNAAGAGGGAAVSPTGQTIFQQSADSLSKVIAGATLVSAKPLYVFYGNIASAVSQNAAALGVSRDSPVYGSALTLYFLVLGFLSGLLLPHFYDLIEPVPGSGGGGGAGIRP
jgi:hypothetical protein